MNTVFEQMLSQYQIVSDKDRRNAIYEVMQQITLAGLYRGGFFDKAAFYGGTCLRIFHKLERFSEDMDFSLLTPDSTFDIKNFFPSIIEEFSILGRDIIITKKDKSKFNKIESAFLKDDTEVYITFYEEKPIAVQPPIKATLKIVETPPGVKGDTATGGTKPATTETGAIVNVPLFLNEGDSIVVNTETGEYVSRA